MRKTAKIFRNYQTAVKRRDRPTELQLSRQTKLDEWEEFRLYEYERHSRIEQELAAIKSTEQSAFGSTDRIECTQTRWQESHDLLQWIELQSVDLAEHSCPNDYQNVRTGWEATHSFVCRKIESPENNDNLFEDRKLLKGFARWIKVQLSKLDRRCSAFRRVSYQRKDQCPSSQAVCLRRSERISRRTPRRSARIRALKQAE